MSEMVIENGGMTITQALELKPHDIVERLHGLPARKFHCSVLGDKALRAAINNYFNGKVETLTNSKHVKKPHSVNIVNSNFSSLLKADSIKVNSYHNNIIKQNILGNELEPFALSLDDETIEGFFHRKFPIAGVMWHPERSVSNDNEMILRYFFSTLDYEQ